MYFLTALIGSLGFATLIGRIAVVALSVVGIGLTTFTGIDYLLDSVVSNISSQSNSLTGNMAQMLHLLGVDTAINIILSSSAVIFVLKGVTGGVLTKLIGK